MISYQLIFHAPKNVKDVKEEYSDIIFMFDIEERSGKIKYKIENNDIVISAMEKEYLKYCVDTIIEFVDDGDNLLKPSSKYFSYFEFNDDKKKEVSYEDIFKDADDESKEDKVLNEIERLLKLREEFSKEDEDLEDDDDLELEKMIDDIYEKMSDEKFDEKEKDDESKKDTSISAYEEIQKLVGYVEFKQIIEEINKIIPIMRENDTLSVLRRQSYLLSVNDGSGVTTCLELFSEFLQSNNVLKAKRGVSFEEIKVKSLRTKEDNQEAFENILNNITSKRGGVVCLDIREWMTNLATAEFRDFLSEVEKFTGVCIIVFRIPFVEKEVLKQICLSLNDLFFIKTISIPPFTFDELKCLCKDYLEEYGYSMSENAWKMYEQRINDEKSDGRFYGVRTVEKVAREILYKKQLSCAINGANNKLIDSKDIEGLSSIFKHEGRSGMEMLKSLVGSEKIVEKVEEILNQIELAKTNSSIEVPCLHMRFLGSPGTGKTTVARIIGKILKERGVLRVGSFFEYSGRDFCGRYVGETAPKVAGMCRDAYGSVLFIDEAYSLYKSDASKVDYGREALDTLIAEMENHRNDMVVIMAGYTDEMEDLMNGNVGLKSRMPYVIEFSSFSREQLFQIFKGMVEGEFEYSNDFMDTAKEYFMALSDKLITSKEFSNARFVRNLYERTWGKAATRCQLEGTNKVVLTKDDFMRASNEKEFNHFGKQKRSIGFN